MLLGPLLQKSPHIPVPGVKNTDFYLQALHSGTIQSVNDGSLTTRPPRADREQTQYTVDYTITKRGFEDRNYYTFPGNPDYTDFDRKGITFTSPPMAQNLTLIGFPVVKLWMSADAASVDVYAYLQMVDEEGVSTNLTEGMLRSNFRGTVQPAFDHMGLPFHRNTRGDDTPLPINEPVLMEFNMSVVSWTIPAGCRLRLTITNCDKDNFNTPELSPAPNITIYHNRALPSSILLPVIPARELLAQRELPAEKVTHERGR